MAFYTRDGVLIEISVLSGGQNKSVEWVVEVWDLSPDTGGELMHISRREGGDLYVDLLGQELSVGFVEWAISVARSELAGY
jgi:hypothetical protein